MGLLSVSNWVGAGGVPAWASTNPPTRKKPLRSPDPLPWHALSSLFFLVRCTPFAGLHQLALGRDSNRVRGGTFGALPSLTSVLYNMRRVDVSRGAGLCHPSFARVAEDHFKSGSGSRKAHNPILCTGFSLRSDDPWWPSTGSCCIVAAEHACD